MGEMVLLLLIIPLLGCLFALLAKKNDLNAFYVCIFTLLCNIFSVLFLLSEVSAPEAAIFYVFNWLGNAGTSITYGVDILSLLVLLGVYMSVLIGLTGLSALQRKNKMSLLLSLYFVWNMTGLIVAKDIISFYVFFVGLLPPVFMLLGVCGNLKKISMLNLFFIFNFAGVLSLLAAAVFTYKFYNGNVLLQNIVFTDMPTRVGVCVWIGACLAFLVRIPIWPFHYWISSVSVSVKNPVASIITNMLPLTGVWGCMCFWASAVPPSIKETIPLAVVLGLLTILFIALIGLAHNDFMRKLFSYSTIYYLFFLLAVIVLEDKYRANVIYSLFTFMIVHASLSVLDLIADRVCEEEHCSYHGILYYMPRLSRLFAFFVFIAAGLPISSMFWNNFVIISAMFRYNFVVGIWCISAIALIGMALLHELYTMYDLRGIGINRDEVEDISDRKQTVFMAVIVILFLSFFNPLWFVF